MLTGRVLPCSDRSRRLSRATDIRSDDASPASVRATFSTVGMSLVYLISLANQVGTGRFAGAPPRLAGAGRRPGSDLSPAAVLEVVAVRGHQRQSAVDGERRPGDVGRPRR